MEAKEKAEKLVNSYRIILMNEDTECGNEILCTSIAKQCALIAVDEVLNQFIWKPSTGMSYWQEVKQEINNL
jgi:hypothetical protein